MESNINVTQNIEFPNILGDLKRIHRRVTRLSAWSPTPVIKVNLLPVKHREQVQRLVKRNRQDERSILVKVPYNFSPWSTRKDNFCSLMSSKDKTSFVKEFMRRKHCQNIDENQVENGIRSLSPPKKQVIAKLEIPKIDQKRATHKIDKNLLNRLIMESGLLSKKPIQLDSSDSKFSKVERLRPTSKPKVMSKFNRVSI